MKKTIFKHIVSSSLLFIFISNSFAYEKDLETIQPETKLEITKSVINTTDSDISLNNPSSYIKPIIVNTAVTNTTYDKLLFKNYLESSKELVSYNINSLKTNEQVVPLAKEENIFQRYTQASQNIIKKGMGYIGVPYRWGGTSETSGFDCSGYVKAVYEKSIGVYLPRTSKEMSKIGEKITSLTKLRPGDLIFFNTRKSSFSHVGIYLGDDKFLHAPRTGQKVRIENLDNSYWTTRFNGARRIVLN